MRPDTIVRKEGMDALIASLGYVDAERFLMLMSREPFDYTRWRAEYLTEQVSVRALSKKAMEARHRQTADPTK